MNRNQLLLKKIEDYNKRSIGASKLMELYNKFELEKDIIFEHMLKDKENKSPITNIVLKYAYVLCVALIQECTRKWIKGLVDRDYKIVLKLASKNKIEFSLDHIGHFMEKKVSLGDFIAHNFVPSSFNELCMTFATITGKDLYDVMRKINAQSTKVAEVEFEESLLFSIIVEVFEQRNIVAHELSEPKEIGMAKILAFCISALTLIEAMDNFDQDMRSGGLAG